MTRFEYKTVPAPRRAKKYRQLKGTEECFARTLEEALNREGAEGWEYLRADSLPCDVKKGLFSGTREELHSVLIFRRALPEPAAGAVEVEEARASAPRFSAVD